MSTTTETQIVPLPGYRFRKPGEIETVEDKY